jgi:phosphate transport system substrate-binding protein
MRNPLLACLLLLVLAFSSLALSSGPLRIDGSNGARPLVAALAAAFSERYPEETVQLGAGMPVVERLPALDEGRIDLIMASHGLEEDALRARGYAVYRFAQMPVVLAVNTGGNPVARITAAQLCGIYAGDYGNWRALNGPDLPITAFARPRVEVDMEVLEAGLPCFGSLSMGRTVQTRERSGALSRALVKTPGAIGMTTLTRVLASEGRLRALAVDGVNPHNGSGVNGDYPLMRDVFLVARPDAADVVQAFLAFVGGPGTEVIRSQGALPRGRSGA